MGYSEPNLGYSWPAFKDLTSAIILLLLLVQIRRQAIPLGV